jgi:hypothetical protein
VQRKSTLWNQRGHTQEQRAPTWTSFRICSCGRCDRLHFTSSHGRSRTSFVPRMRACVCGDQVEALVSDCGVSALLPGVVRKIWFRYLSIRPNQVANLNAYLERLNSHSTLPIVTTIMHRVVCLILHVSKQTREDPSPRRDGQRGEGEEGAGGQSARRGSGAGSGGEQAMARGDGAHFHPLPFFALSFFPASR